MAFIPIERYDEEGYSIRGTCYGRCVSFRENKDPNIPRLLTFFDFPGSYENKGYTFLWKLKKGDRVTCKHGQSNRQVDQRIVVIKGSMPLSYDFKIHMRTEDAIVIKGRNKNPQKPVLLVFGKGSISVARKNYTWDTKDPTMDTYEIIDLPLSKAEKESNNIMSGITNHIVQKTFAPLQKKKEWRPNDIIDILTNDIMKDVVRASEKRKREREIVDEDSLSVTAVKINTKCRYCTINEATVTYECQKFTHKLVCDSCHILLASKTPFKCIECLKPVVKVIRE